MKILTGFLLFCICCLTCRGQENDQAKDHFEINAGFAIPLKPYSPMSLLPFDNKWSSSAKTGIEMGVGATFFLGKNFGFAFKGGYIQSAMDTNYLFKSFNNAIIATHSTVGDYKHFFIMFGPALSLSQDNLDIELSLTAGIIHSEIPNVSSTIILGANTYNGIQPMLDFYNTAAQSSSAMCASAGFRMFYAISKKSSVLFYADLFYADEFPNIQTSDTYYGYIIGSGQQEMKVIILNTGLGLSFQL